MALRIEKYINEDCRFYGGTLPAPRGGAKNFAFFVHPLSEGNFALMEPKMARWLKKKEEDRGGLVEIMIREALAAMRLKAVGQIRVRAKGRESHGIFIMVPYLPADFLAKPKQAEILQTLLEGAQVARGFGAEYLGMGAFTSIVTGNGHWLDQQEENVIPLTSGSAGTAVGVKLGVLEAAARLGIRPQHSRLVLVGATGAVGRPTSLLLAPRFQGVTLVARNEPRLAKLKQQLLMSGLQAERIQTSTDLNASIREADVVILATNVKDAQELGLDSMAFAPGALVVDVARPHNITPEMVLDRPDILVIEGAVFSFPGETDFHRFLQMGGPNRAFGCLSETAAWALAGEIESKSVGPLVDLATVKQMESYLRGFRFRLAGFRMFDQSLEELHFEEIRQIRRYQRLSLWRPAPARA